MGATTTARSGSGESADSAAPAALRHDVIHLLPTRGQKSPKAGQLCTNPLQPRRRCVPLSDHKPANFRYLRLMDAACPNRAVARDLISSGHSCSGRSCPPPVGKRVSDTGQRRASARVMVVPRRIAQPGNPDAENNPRRPNEPPDTPKTPETPPDEPPPTPVEEPPPPGKGPYVAGSRRDGRVA